MRSEEGLLLLDDGGAIHWANSEAAKLLGFSLDELRQKSLPLILGTPGHTASCPSVAKAFQAIVAGDLEEVAGNAQFVGNGNDRIAARWKLWALPALSERPRLLLSLSQTAEASVNSPTTFGCRDIFENAVEGIFRSTVEGQYLDVNPALARMYGYGTPIELIRAMRNLNTGLYVDPNRRAEFIRLMSEQGYVADFESEVFTADGRAIWITEFARTVRDQNGLVLYYEGSVIETTRRKHSEAALKRSEEKFRHFVEMTSMVPWEADLTTGRFTYVGPQCVKFLGYSADEWLKPGFWEQHVHPEDGGWAAIVRAEAIEKRQNFECEYRMIRADERVVWTREMMSISSERSDPNTIGGFLLDVTFRKETEESLRESRHFIEQIASASPTILYVYDPSRTQCIYVNGRAPDILGFSSKALSEMHPLFILSLAHENELEEHHKHLENLGRATPNSVIQREFRLRTSVGTWAWVSSREGVFKRDSQGSPTRMVGTLEDITLTRYAIDELETSEALFRRLAETTRVVPFDFDITSNHFTYVGPQAEMLLGYPPEHWQGLDSWLEILHADDITEGTRFVSETCKPPRDFQTEFRVRTADGRVIWLRQIVHCESEEDDRTFVRGFLIDVTESKEIEEERERSRAELRELSARSHNVREQERMNIAREIHDELGQALTLLRLDLAWLSREVAKPVSEIAFQALADKAVEMEQMIAGTLQTVRHVLSALRPPLLDELGLADAIEWHAKEFARHTGLRCDVEVEPVEDIPIEAALAIFRIFQEITTNIARHAKASRAKVDLRTRGPNLVLVVTDNGLGILESDKRKEGHFGLLGMRERAWAFGGQVWVDSEPGAGTRVRVELPLQKILPRCAGDV